MIARNLRVEGRVQGVGYRDAMVDAALAANVQGFVRNTAEGHVEAHLQGGEEAVARMIAWAARGPRMARVERVLVETADPDPRHASFHRA
ncbi:MAG TPA: acylphosphatase [Casimicrobiaceae bacterium]|jgi:acylphosphatase